MSRAVARADRAVELPAPGTYTIDAAHSSVEFVARHLMIAKVRGRFRDFSGSVGIGERPEDAHVDVAIDAATIDTSNTGRDEHLRSPDFLDVATFPHLRFRSTSIEQDGESSLRMTGDLTIRDVTRPVTLDVAYLGVVRDPWGNTKAGFTASGELDREEWGITWNQALETGGVVVGKKVRIELEVEVGATG